METRERRVVAEVNERLTLDYVDSPLERLHCAVHQVLSFVIHGSPLTDARAFKRSALRDRRWGLIQPVVPLGHRSTLRFAHGQRSSGKQICT